MPPDDEQALVAALSHAATDADERRRRGARAATDARERYGWQAIAARIAALYEQVFVEPTAAPDAGMAARGGSL